MGNKKNSSQQHFIDIELPEESLPREIDIKVPEESTLQESEEYASGAKEEQDQNLLEEESPGPEDHDLPGESEISAPEEEVQAREEEEEEEPEGAESEIEKLKQEMEEQLDRAMRLQADFENYRKRMKKEKEEWTKFSNAELIKELLPVLDNLERAIEHVEEGEDKESMGKGVELICQQFQQVFEKFDVQPVSALGQPFDPQFHEAIQQMETEDYPPNTVMNELQKGYLLHGRLVRPALVVVAQEPASASTEHQDEASEHQSEEKNKGEEPEPEEYPKNFD